ncbi:MAG TPA: YihA family ribosome biogenesis GTP-binding protein, partial [Anaerovoracaceae bacterium]|nr:YihA family ribosome biogenesis GTP-binding protein [Anaerovoracaceae bacterium]
GYAKVSRSVSEDWGPMMETYLSERDNLVRVIQLVDIRHKPSLQDCQMYEWLRHFGLSGTVIATKADKVSKSELNRSIHVICRALGLSDEDVVLPVSVLKRTGVEAVLETLDALLLME